MKTFLHAFSLLILAMLFLISCSKEDQARPNIILILADDMGWSDLGSYGSEIHTPHLDQLAYQGKRFTQFYNTAKCFPSRACLLTGVYAQDCNYDSSHQNLITNALTLGETLRSAGYSTYWSGKHHGQENPIYRGFDHYFGLRDGACNHFNPGLQRAGEAKPAQKRDNRAWCIDSTLYQPYTPSEKDFYTTDYFTNYGLQYLEDASEKGQPFFLYLAYTAPHDPLMAWQEDIERYSNKYDVGYEKIRHARYEKQQKLGLINKQYKLSEDTHENWDSLSVEERQIAAQKMEVYAAMIDRLDQNIGRILQKLKTLQLDQNTLILFMSDNGASAEVVNLENDQDDAKIGSMERWVSLGDDWANVSNTPFRFFKNYSYEGGIRTPLIAYWKGRIQPNSISDFPGHFIDLMPTFLELAQGEYPTAEDLTPLRGQSLVPALLSQESKRTQPLFWQWQEGRAVRQNHWKIVKHQEEDSWDLYDLKNDPTELENLSTKFPEKVGELDSLYIDWWNNCTPKKQNRKAL